MNFGLSRTILLLLLVSVLVKCDMPEAVEPVEARLFGTMPCVANADCPYEWTCVDYGGYCQENEDGYYYVNKCTCENETEPDGECYCLECDCGEEDWIDTGMRLCRKPRWDPCETDDDCKYEPGLTCSSYSGFCEPGWGTIPCRSEDDCEWGWDCVDNSEDGISMYCDPEESHPCCSEKVCAPPGRGVPLTGCG
mgnify:CR=1 FL=1